MLGGDGLSFDDRRRIDAALATAHRVSDLDFEAYLGPAGDAVRDHAYALHSHLPEPEQMDWLVDALVARLTRTDG